FTSTDGADLCRQILQGCMPHDTHDFQLSAITHLLDGQDVLMCTATGTGKTDTFIRLMHIVLAISENPSLAPGTKFPRHPAMVVVCPTKVLEEEMAEKMIKAGLTALAINADTLDMARKKALNLFKEALEGYHVLLVSPELLKSSGFAGVLDSPKFSSRICMLAVDEVHLVVTWGKSFRKDYEQIGVVRSRLRNIVPMIGVSATVRTGATTQRILEVLGFQEGQYHILRRSNLRHDIHIIFRTMRSSIGGIKFPELNWVLADRRKKVIFCNTIHFGFRVQSHLFRLPEAGPHRAKRIRMFNALNWKTYNDQTLKMFRDGDPDAQIIIATAIFSVGMDAPAFDDIIAFGEPVDVEQWLQQGGRIRPREGANDPRYITYVTAGAVAAAEGMVQGPGSDAKTSMDPAMASIILADCKINQLDKIFGNPQDDPPCSCTTCQIHPSPTRSSPCSCSGPSCQPE
ncbi:P-loop containing nucleoside triphosphate hydrolase protein, partial [Suillus clintonianus]|uniref:P-loop containing nucleoside triphosphate hydrolase protein n=1 Tax=Suillus clintonianus TaxID=1904413 RepID=UPI001B85EDB9